MKFTGAWFNPEYSGEGITIIEHADGTVIAHFFSYYAVNGGEGGQLWLIASGKREGNSVTMQAFVTRGGRMADPEILKLVEEIPWGKIVLEDRAPKLIMRLLRINHPEISYLVQPIHAVPVAEDPPAPAGPIVSVQQKAFKQAWMPVAKPHPQYGWIWGNSEIDHSDIPAGVYSEALFEVLKGPVTIKDIATGEDDGKKLHNLRVSGAVKGQVFNTGERIALKFSLSKAAAPLPTLDYRTVTWTVDTVELGRIVQLSARPMYRY